MAYVAATNPPIKIADGIGGGPTLWLYKSADAKATVIAAGYITNALDLGFRVGDLVLISDTTTPLASLTCVSVVASTGSTLV